MKQKRVATPTGWEALKSGVFKRKRFYLGKYKWGWFLWHSKPYRTWGPYDTRKECEAKRLRLLKKWQEEAV